MVTSYVGIDTIIERINSESIPNTYWNIDEVKEWIYTSLSFINSKTSNVKTSKIIEITDYKGLIPADVERVDRVIYEYSQDNFKELHLILSTEEINDNNYDENAGYIYVNFETGFLTLNYYTVPTDEEGKPLIPDEKYYIQAVVSFIKYKLGARAYWQGKILERQLQMLEQDWLFYLPAAQNNIKMGILKDPKRFRKISYRHFIR